jgi:glycosyltransferase involved in cell wall biosynthesis
MRFTIVTPSYGQLDWLELCIASVADQHGVDAIEHIVCDAGSEGIEEFARRMGAGFYQDGKRVFGFQCSVDGEFVGAEDTKADSAQCTSWSLRRPVSSNLGSVDGESVGAEGESVERKGYSLTIYTEKDEGMYDAINKGLLRATGDVCAYLNCDEQYLPRTLRWVADYLSVSLETQVLFGAAIVTRADGSYVCDRRVMVPTRWHTMVSGNLSIFTSSTFFRRKSVVERGLLFDPQWRVCGDAVWALRFLEAGLRMEATNKPLSAFAETGVNMSATDNPRAAEEGLRLALSAPAAARALKPGVLLAYRFRRWLSGAYALNPHNYAIYTVGDVRQRKRFEVNEPAFRWRTGVEAR